MIDRRTIAITLLALAVIAGIMGVFACLEAAPPHKHHKVIIARIVTHLNNVVVDRDAVFIFSGKPCDYGTIPAEAVPYLIELGPDGRTVVKVHFRRVNLRE